MTEKADISARRVAVVCLGQILQQRAALDQVLPRELDAAGLSQRDRALTRLLVATTLRRLGQIDAVLGRLLDRPLGPRLAHIHNILRLGAAQLLFADMPAYAVVDGAVRLAKAARGQAHAGLVNAVLRRIAREADSLLAHIPAVPANTPDWLWSRWTATYGADTAAAIATQHLTVPPTDLTCAGDAAAWAARLDGTVLPNGSIRRAGGGRVSDLPGYHEGAWWVQDAAATLPARLLGDIAEKPVLDLCAAPGGKTAQLAAAGARVTAVDRSASRMDTLRINLARLRLRADCVIGDVESYRPATPPQLILLDAPCSATGAIRRNPDIPWTRQPTDIAHAAKLQSQLLESACDMLAPGGRLVYAVCSLEPEEGIAQIDRLLQTHASFAREPVGADAVGGIDEWLTADGDVRTLPHHLSNLGGIDGFYICRLQRQ